MNKKVQYSALAIVCVALVGALWLLRGDQAVQAQGQEIADSHMAQWLRQNPTKAADWIAEEKERHKILPPADNSYLLEGEQREGHAYGRYTEKDILLWAREAEKLVVEGSRIFHSSDLMASSIAVSCDMCHPDAANTHPETYPKYQVQMGRVVISSALSEDAESTPTARDGVGQLFIDRALGADGGGSFSVSVGMQRPLVAIGAPVGNYLPPVAERLNAQLFIPEHAEVRHVQLPTELDA